MQLGFIGLGRLGKAIAGRLIDCGHELTVWNRSAGKTDGLKATVAATPADVARVIGERLRRFTADPALETALARLNAIDAAGADPDGKHRQRHKPLHVSRSLG